jgi:hypothetical protein
MYIVYFNLNHSFLNVVLYLFKVTCRIVIYPQTQFTLQEDRRSRNYVSNPPGNPPTNPWPLRFHRSLMNLNHYHTKSNMLFLLTTGLKWSANNEPDIDFIAPLGGVSVTVGLSRGASGAQGERGRDGNMLVINTETTTTTASARPTAP